MRPKDYSIIRQTPNKGLIGGSTLAQWLEAVEQAADGDARRREIALGGPIRTLAQRSRFDGNKPHFYRESDIVAGHCGRGVCSDRPMSPIHLQDGDINRISRAAKERVDLG